MKKWRQSRISQEIPTTGNGPQSQQMKWRSSRSSQQEVANSMQVLESGGGIGGSYFRSLSEDLIPPSPSSTLPAARHGQEIEVTKSSTASPSRPPSSSQPLSESVNASVDREPPLSTVLPVVAPEYAAVNPISVTQESLISNHEDFTPIGTSIDLDLKKEQLEEDPWSYNKKDIIIASREEDYNTTTTAAPIDERLDWSAASSVSDLEIPGHTLATEEIPEDPWSSRASRQFSPMASTASLISSQIQTSARVKLRCSWAPGVAAIVVALSAAASLGNLLRLPRLVLLHGGGPFLVAYILLLFVLGLPLVFLEIGLGQFCQQGSLQIYRAVPLLKGVGLVKLATNVLMCAYYPVLMAVSLFSLIWSAKGPIPFSECTNLSTDRYHHALGISLASSKEISIGEQCLKESILKPPQEDAMWLGVNYALLFLLWALLLLSQWGGTAWYRRTMVITLPLGMAALITVLSHALAVKQPDWPLDWSNWGSLLEPKVWYFATVQVFFSTQVGFGIHVTHGGKLFPKKNAFWVSLSLVLVNVVMALGAVWVAWLWLQTSSVQTPSQLVSDLPEVLILSLLIDYAGNNPESLAQLWACLGCVMLVIAGFISTASLLYTLITAVASETPAEKLRRWHIVLVICALGFVAGVLCFVPVHLQFVHILDHYVIGRLIMATTILELIGFAWIYGCNTLYNDFEFVLGQKMNISWKVIWIIAPFALLGIELWSIFSLPLDGLPRSQKTTNKPDPEWATITGWSMYLSMWVIVFGSAMWTLGQQVDYNFSDRLRSSIKPSSKWGPADPLHRHGWVRWRTQYSTTGRKDFTLRRRGTRDYTHSARGSPTTTLGRPSTNKNGPSPLAAVGTAASMPWQTSPSP